MKKIAIIFSAILVFISINEAPSIADVIPKNPQLISATTSSVSVKRGEVFTVTVGVDAFDGYIYSLGGSFYSTLSYPSQNTGFECRGYMPTEGDSSKVLVVQKGLITLKCVVPRNSLEGKYRLNYFDLSSVGCKKTYVMEFSNPAGVSCPHAWTHYAYRSGGFDKSSDAYATENQTTSLNYPVDVFTSFPTISVSGITPLEVPQIDLIKAFPDQLSATYYFGSAWDRDMTGLCAVESNIGTLSTNWVLSPPSLPLNGAAQPQFNETVNLNVRDLKPRNTVDLKITCKATNGEVASKIFQYQTVLPDPPKIPSIKISSVTDQTALLEVQGSDEINTTREYILNGISQKFTGGTVLLSSLKENSTNTVKVKVTDLYDQSTTSSTVVFRTIRTVVVITCQKGKLVRKVSGSKPICPLGFKKI